MAAGLALHVRAVQPQGALGGFLKARLARQMAQALQGEGSHAVARGGGVVVPGLDAVDQRLVVVAGEEEPAGRILEMRVSRASPSASAKASNPGSNSACSNSSTALSR
jgi:hypothetical protein